MKKNNLFLISFLPALLYWYLEETQTVEIAIIGGLSLAILEIAFEKIFFKHIHSISKLNFVIILILGPISLIGKDGVWFKLQPFFTGIFLSSFLIFNLKRGKSLMLTMMKDMEKKVPMPEFIMEKIEYHLAFFLLINGIFMGYLAIYETTSTWAFFKSIGFYLVFLVFLVAEIFVIRKLFKKYMLEKMNFGEQYGEH
ncbi:intracellular septation protein A [Halobacteriovorax sp. BALOs_7]|uniref:Intracellular septation protein A n=1 Tax=Halobacteriovorax vibrionivorans TaxID=2152716 RepID=A0ABY0IHU1_9BACT|nr:MULTISPECIES: septation protein IspZ [Halobacteriovorax]AYF45438.1 intracellular septation protein A [Halobacteriovorax sp. BALOs_7]RZF22517.1 hypothetical protein DAY19_01740 [Halobacteriovorax vibrionivorans]TGD47709.1 hypothetical protein EP118_07105 [Halobacteriovorax sp. Y22]